VPSDGSYDKLFGSSAAAMPLESSPDDELPDTHYKKIEKLLEIETESRGRPKALCYEDIKERLHDPPAYTRCLCHCDSCKLSATRRLVATL
jgi:hypothetical protein